MDIFVLMWHLSLQHNFLVGSPGLNLRFVQLTVIFEKKKVTWPTGSNGWIGFIVHG